MTYLYAHVRIDEPVPTQLVSRVSTAFAYLPTVPSGVQPTTMVRRWKAESRCRQVTKSAVRVEYASTASICGGTSLVRQRRHATHAPPILRQIVLCATQARAPEARRPGCLPPLPRQTLASQAHISARPKSLGADRAYEVAAHVAVSLAVYRVPRRQTSTSALPGK